MYDNKVRLSKDVIEKAELIAAEWGLKNARAAIEAVFRKYADDYLYGRLQGSSVTIQRSQPVIDRDSQSVPCEAIDELDDLLGL
ncbi:hypothetical protein [Leptolyngbya sp. NIES-2104]|uniref:hypothetical protein n=1 Tax=Leptolyngbya sp. NIES-2104 TaxID=1552121 RepID=UPI0006ECC413|nr:hypothetical protein [Leptolyngbya sp. NIES-2104]GAP98230.1 hypothetical protein NIES2104_47830 [Leptolyngbya sp. NIES-2104]